METDIKAAAAEAVAKPAEAPAVVKPRSTVFDFEHKVFAIEGGYFSLSNDKKAAVFHVPLGTTFGTVPLPTLRTTFEIADDSYDSQLLGIVEASLRFVKIIRPGESIPPELLDGSASWSVSEEHRTLARNRLLIQLSSWVSGHEMVVSDSHQIEQVIEDPITKQRIAEAYVQLTERVGLPPERQKEVVARVASFAHELAYIEALRDRFGAVRSIVENIGRLRNAYRLDRTFAAEIIQMQKLFRTPVVEFQTIFDQVDAQSGEILALVKNLQSQIAFTRRMRDELHSRVMDWDDMIERWRTVEIERTTANENLVKHTYRFLAQRYLKTSVWKRD
ncbi:MAG: hypothetical protein WCK65_07510 [Rhodospirillaceae bacterium]